METFPKNACYGHPQTAIGKDKKKQPDAKPCTYPYIVLPMLSLFPRATEALTGRLISHYTIIIGYVKG